jgi:hypothetical protein
MLKLRIEICDRARLVIEVRERSINYANHDRGRILVAIETMVVSDNDHWVAT